MSTKTPTPPTTAAVAPAAPVAPVAAARAPSSRKAAAKKPAAMPAGPVNASASAKSTPKAAAKPAAKPLAKAFAQPDKPAKAEAAPKAAKPTKADAKPAKPAKPAKVKKPKLVRDRFTVTADDYGALVALKQRAAKLAVPVKKERPAARRHSPAHRLSDTASRPSSVSCRPQADCRKEGRQELKRLGPATPSSACAARPASMHQSSSGVWTVTTTVCSTPSRSRLRTHQTAPLRTGHSGFCKPSKRDRVCPRVG
jgi:hypothetical protein